MKHVTIEEEYELLGRVNELVGDCQELLLRLEVAPLRIRELKTALRTMKVVAQEHQVAAEIMMTTSLADTFPDGSEAPSTLTPRQVMYLAALAYPGTYARELVGLPPSRACIEETKAGDKCGSSSMLFTARAVCHSHGTDAERRRNAKMKVQWNLDHPDYDL